MDLGKSYMKSGRVDFFLELKGSIRLELRFHSQINKMCKKMINHCMSSSLHHKVNISNWMNPHRNLAGILKDMNFIQRNNFPSMMYRNPLK
jgi:hypothetical protein